MTRDHFRFLLAAALVDGSIGEKEKPVLLEAASSLGIEPAEVSVLVRELVASVRAGKSILADLPDDTAGKTAIFEGMIGVVTADGKVDPREIELFRRLAPRFGMTPEEAERVVNTAGKIVELKTYRFQKVDFEA